MASSAWVAAWACLVIPAAPGADALHYLAMVKGPVSQVMAPYCFRVGAPLVARALPLSPELGLTALTLGCLGLAGGLWVLTGRRLGLSRRSLAMAALAVGSTQGWAGFFNNPYLTDGAGLLGITAVFAAWACDAFWLGLLVLAIGPLFRETVTPMSLLWVWERKWPRLGLALAVTSAPLLLLHGLPGMPSSQAPWEVAREVLGTKGPIHILGDAIASYHALWLAALLGLGLAPRERRRIIAPPLALMLLAACGLSVVALNTVRMFTLALPFMALAIAEFFEALCTRHPRTSWGLAMGLALGGLVWFPTRGLGSAISSHRYFQYLFAFCALAAILVAWRRLHRDASQRDSIVQRLTLGGSPRAG